MDQDQIPATNPGQEANINLRHYWHVILERRWLVITAFISVFVLSLIYLFKATPIYQATARIQINREMDNVLNIKDMFAFDGREQDYLQTQYKNLLSRSLIHSVVNQLKLEKDERYAKALDPVKAVSDDIQISPIRLTRLVEVKVNHPDKQKAALIANTLVQTFIDTNLDKKMEAGFDVVTRLQTEANAQKTRLEMAEQTVHEWSAKHQHVSFDETENIMLQALRRYQEEHARANSEAAAAESIIDEIDALLSAGAPLESIPQVRTSPEIQAIQRELAGSKAIFAELKQRYKAKHPDYIQAQERINSLDESLRRQGQTLIDALRNQATIAKAAEETLRNLVRQQENQQLQFNQLRIEYGVRKREADQNDLLYKTILLRMKETELTARNQLNNMHVVDAATIPIKPIKPRIVLTLFLGVVGGLGVAMGLAFFVNYLDDSIKSQDDIENYLRLPFLGYIPNIKTNSVVERDLQAHLHPQSNAAEGFRTIRATVSLTHKPEKYRVLSVTSTIPSEGKSLVASNFAIVTAQTGLRTLLVDSDLRRPSVHKAYQLHSPSGLSSFLMGEVNDLEEITHKTEVPNLDVVCCGAVPGSPSELIGSKRMHDFLQTVRKCYDRVVLDCPPISAVADPLILSAMADGVVFVTKFNKIRREHARKSVQRLHNAGIHVMGVVLNDIDFEGKDSYYYSYYYYQNRYYASHYKTGAGKKETPAVLTHNGG